LDTLHQKRVRAGIALAILASLIWSGNFIVARAARGQIPPFTLAYFRWLVAILVVTPLAWKYISTDFQKVQGRPWFFFGAALTGVTLFNTFIYLGGQYSSAINMALIGTTSSPIIAIALSAIFFQEKISWQRILGIFVCLSGILLLLSKGRWQTILELQFNRGDLLVLAAAFSFAIYNILVRKQPVGMNPFSFLWYTFVIGWLLLTPMYIRESVSHSITMPPMQTLGIFLYIGVGASFVSFLCWNAAISRLGPSRTAIFGNLIPIFSTLEAVLLLNEDFLPVQIISALLVVIGLVFTWKQ
jgi:drug/metabolite transporter (DMT)-like permease